MTPYDATSVQWCVGQDSVCGMSVSADYDPHPRSLGPRNGADNVQNLRITVCKHTGPQSAHHVTCMSRECHVILIVTYFSLDAFVIVCVPVGLLKASYFRDIIVSEYR